MVLSPGGDDDLLAGRRRGPIVGDPIRSGVQYDLVALAEGGIVTKFQGGTGRLQGMESQQKQQYQAGVLACQYRIPTTQATPEINQVEVIGFQLVGLWELTLTPAFHHSKTNGYR